MLINAGIVGACNMAFSPVKATSINGWLYLLPGLTACGKRLVWMCRGRFRFAIENNWGH